MFTTGVPNRPYVETDMLESRRTSSMSWADDGDVFAAMRERAGELGCDGLIVLGSHDRVVGSGRYGGVSTLQGYRGTCIMWTDAQPTARR